MMRRWMWISLAWVAFGVFAATQLVAVYRSEGMHHNWPLVFVVTAGAWVPWALVTAPVLWLGLRFPIGWRGHYQNWLLHLAAGIAINFAFSAWSALLEGALHPFDTMAPSVGFVQSMLGGFVNNMLSTAVLYAGILLIQRAIEARQLLLSQEAALAHLNEQLTRAHLDALRRQIEPHFLFNTLNAVAGLVREGRSKEAIDTIASLAEFFRGTLGDVARGEVPLCDELEYVTRYLEIQKVRFADRLQLCIDIPPSLRSAAVPNLILQPVVENAVKHGIARRAEGGAISISATDASGVLVVRVRNHGPALRPGWDEHGGMGIANVRARLQSLYGDASTLDLNDRVGGVEAVLRMPLRAGIIGG